VPDDIYRQLRTRSPWADSPERYLPPTTCGNRLRRWAKTDMWDRIFEDVSKAYDDEAR
jgi:transposase